MERVNQSITKLIAQNPSSAKILHSLGIYFYNYSENSLAEICTQRGIKPEWVIQKLNDAIQSQTLEPGRIDDYPIDLIIEYLKHSHYIFIKDRLRYLGQIIDNYPAPNGSILADVQEVFPDFAQEFIEHVYEEEDTIFAYITELKKIQDNKAFLDYKEIVLPKKSIQDFENEHHQLDDEMQGIRELTRSFNLAEVSDVHAKVIFEALSNFSEELKIHAKIENEILFPKAIKLEQEVKALLSTPE
ncbi:MAG: hemerythrin domain-containing protein [Microscillaceae bacterium]|nr:hemerythrin domain-containing protein [Microscillaceae bacterium]